MALRMGRGGRLLINKTLGINRVRINIGNKELHGELPIVEVNKKRRKGGGRKTINVHHL